jgi:hypothetical protein
MVKSDVHTRPTTHRQRLARADALRAYDRHRLELVPARPAAVWLQDQLER